MKATRHDIKAAVQTKGPHRLSYCDASLVANLQFMGIYTVTVDGVTYASSLQPWVSMVSKNKISKKTLDTLPTV